MKKMSRELRQWRAYFRSSNLNIFYIIEFALRVAAIDHPKEFKLRRDGINELLFSIGDIDSDKVENVVDVEGKRKCKNELNDCDVEKRKSESNVEVEALSDEIEEESRVVNEALWIKKSYVEVEALSDEIEEESRVVNEALSLKKIIDNNQNESDSNIYKSLKRLQMMALSVEILQNTEIGKSVNTLRWHNSKNIRCLVRKMVKGWIEMVQEWVDARATLTERKSESTKAFVVDEEDGGLPAPPLEDIPFLFTQTTSIELSQIFDGMDDDGNVVISVGEKDEQEKKQTSVLVKPNMPPGGNSGRGRTTKPTLEQKLNNDHEMKLKEKSDQRKIQTRPVSTQQNKLKCPDEDAEHLKLEATKRKLHECYQEVENAKRQRIQVMKLKDIPKQGCGIRKPHNRPLKCPELQFAHQNKCIYMWLDHFVYK
ncbi:probable mediator of RNA polymerase II transcription subunit 26b [Solanum verrucosum]|uniref:probable mediator of RNA polymerase II transcription subunit 26b n=1 Tax=Solanum verrucosum TaxID=315347 RepID=UPI0020D01BBF|nr:probable mediator of RNA polymerase II transcription subunit 26b [Solanum verrucosum]